MERRHVLVAELEDGIEESDGDLEEIHVRDRCDDLAGGGGAFAPVLIGREPCILADGPGEKDALRASGRPDSAPRTA
jgi:hypothetical protein